jgi:hypothetical protein
MNVRVLALLRVLLLCAVQVGSVNNTFGVKGVEENCLMFKTIEDAHKLRGQLSGCFERAALPYVSDTVTNNICNMRYWSHAFVDF